MISSASWELCDSPISGIRVNDLFRAPAKITSRFRFLLLRCLRLYDEECNSHDRPILSLASPTFEGG